MAYEMTVRRKLAIATWGPPSEGNIYGKLTLDATEALAYLEHLRATTGEKVSMTHLVGKAVGMALKKAPDLNGRILFGRYVPHTSVDIAFLVTLDDGKNLAKAKVCNIDEKPVNDIAKELRELAERLRTGKDDAFKKSMGPVKMMPTWLLRPVLYYTGFLASALGWSIPALGVEPFPFGGAIITSVGMMGLDEGFAPPTPFARVPLYVLIGAVRDMPAAIDGQVVVRKQVVISATIDHRFLDGYQGAVLAKAVRDVFENPWKLSGMDGRPQGSIASEVAK